MRCILFAISISADWMLKASALSEGRAPRAEEAVLWQAKWLLRMRISRSLSADSGQMVARIAAKTRNKQDYRHYRTPITEQRRAYDAIFAAPNTPRAISGRREFTESLSAKHLLLSIYASNLDFAKSKIQRIVFNVFS